MVSSVYMERVSPSGLSVQRRIKRTRPEFEIMRGRERKRERRERERERESESERDRASLFL